MTDHYWHFAKCDDNGTPRTEEWRAIDGYDGDYEVSNCGQVRTWKATNGKSRLTEPRAIQQRITNNYLTVSLWHKNQRKQWKVHRLVAMAFFGVAPLGYQVNHKDGNKQNNVVGNLEWTTAKENLFHASTQLGVSFGRSGESNHRAKLTNAQVEQIRSLIRQGLRNSEIASRFGVSGNFVSKIRYNKTRKYTAELERRALEAMGLLEVANG